MKFAPGVTASQSAPLIPCFSIGEAAELLGVSRATLRIWEREQLISPRRTKGGHRLYTPTDVARMREIVRLRNEERLNAAAIRRELGPSEPVDDSSASRERQTNLGQRLRTLRTNRGWSLAEVAERTDLSVSFLSALERGTASTSVGNLFKLADAYGTTVPGLGTERPSVPKSMLHPSDRLRFVAGRGSVMIEDLIAGPGALEAQRIEIQPGGESGGAYTHSGEEFIYVLAGRRVLLVEEERYQLAEGASLLFRSERSHQWWNDGDIAATVMWVNVPLAELTFGTPAGRIRAERR